MRSGPTVRAPMDPVQRLYVMTHEFVNGEDCKAKFEVPRLSGQSVDIQDYSQYEGEFFEGVRRQQLEESLCLQSYVQLIDQNKNPKPNPSPSSIKRSVERTLRMVQDSSSGDRQAMELQKAVLEDVHAKLPEICRRNEEMKQFQMALELANENYKKAKQAEIARRMNRYAIGLPVPEAAEKLSLAVEKYSKAQREYANYQKSLWSGLNSHMQKFVLSHCGTKLNEQEWVSGMLDRNRSSSFQVQVIEKIKKENEDRLPKLEKAKAPFSHTMKVDLVTSGAALYYINSYGASAKGFKEFSCYIEGAYGKGRSFVLDRTRDGATLAAFALSLNPEWLALAGASRTAQAGQVLRLFGTTTENVVQVSGRVLQASSIASASLAPLVIEMQKNGVCDDGLNSVVTAPICKQLEAAKSEDDRVNVLVSDYKDRFACSKAGLELASTLPFPLSKSTARALTNRHLAVEMFQSPVAASLPLVGDAAKAARNVPTRWRFDIPLSDLPSSAKRMVDRHYAENAVIAPRMVGTEPNRKIMELVNERFGSVTRLFEKTKFNPSLTTKRIEEQGRNLQRPGSFVTGTYIIDKEGNALVIFPSDEKLLVDAIGLYSERDVVFNHVNFETLLAQEPLQVIEQGSFQLRRGESGRLEIANVSIRTHLGFEAEEYLSHFLPNPN